ncbi:GAF domain-containing protein [Pseudonocardia kunmingensis]|uniref:GAF domain-containing protein n=1 Tax=Pseudonocardia kunmingensis TaxID=630975 RepID=A0A543DZQ6_9PSEU|nr:GAF domain-containing protein [Pseudonocardia kunmingensis]TQM14764.1 GAF domain-containing protein [Pseudonocardia kunmingensis]
MTAADPTLTSLALHLARLSAGELDLRAELGRLCEALPPALGVAAALVMVTEPSDEEPTVAASDAQAGWMGAAQRRAGTGPLPAVIRSGRPLHTPDLTRLGPPELAAVAAETGRASSVVVPLRTASAGFGALQLLGDARRPVQPRDLDAARTVLEVLVARLVDVRALRVLAVPRPRPPVTVDPGDVATTVLPVAPPPRHGAEERGGRRRAEAARAAIPAPRRSEPRHRRDDAEQVAAHPSPGAARHVR